MSKADDDTTLEAELAAMPPPPPTRKPKAARPAVNLAPPGAVAPAAKEEGAEPQAMPAAEAPQVIGPAGGTNAPAEIAPEAPMTVGPVHRLAGQPGALLRQAVAIVPRSAGAGLAGVSPDRQRHRQRIAEMAGQIAHLVRVANGAAANIAALSKALRDSHGGKEEAQAEGFDLERAETFCREMEKVLDVFAPKA